MYISPKKLTFFNIYLRLIFGLSSAKGKYEKAPQLTCRAEKVFDNTLYFNVIVPQVLLAAVLVATTGVWGFSLIKNASFLTFLLI